MLSLGSTAASSCIASRSHARSTMKPFSCSSLPLSLCIAPCSDLQSVAYVIGSTRILASISLVAMS
eukprot:8024687-Pyramimonas_sp.AAC.1